MTAIERAAIQKIVDCLPHGEQAKRRANGVRVSCPCPDHGNGDGDQNPSLDVDLKNGKILVKCRVGCPNDKVMAAFAAHGITPEDLRAPNGQPAKRTIEATYDYPDERNELLYQEVRYRPKGFALRRPRRPDDPPPRDDEDRKWVWSVNGVRRVLYRLPELAEQQRIIWVEGPKDADNVWKLGLATTTTAGGTGGLTPWLAQYVAQIVALAPEQVCCFRDNDAPGETYRLTIARALHDAGLRVKLVDLPSGPWKDVSDFINAGGTREKTREKLLELMEAAPVYTPTTIPSSIPTTIIPGPATWQLHDVATLPTWDFPPIEWVIEHLIPAKSLVWLGGLPKRYKSLLMLYLCLAIAYRQAAVADNSLSRFKIITYPKILYVAREDGGSRIKERCVDITNGWNHPLPELGALQIVIRPHLDLLDPEHIAWLRETCRQKGIELLILDTWTALSPTADPMAAEDQARLAAVVTELRDDINGTVVVVDHSRKNRPDPNQPLSSADIYGPHQKWAAAEHIIMLEVVDERHRRIEVFVEGKDGETQRFFLTVSARGSALEKFSYGGSVDQIAEVSRDEGRNNLALVLETLRGAGRPLGVAEIIKETAKRGVLLSRSTIKKHLGDLIAQGRAKASGKGKNTSYAPLSDSAEGPSRPNHHDQHENLYDDE